MPGSGESHPDHQNRSQNRVRSSGPLRTIRAQDAEHLLDLRRQLRRIPQSARAIARGPQPVAQPLHMIGHGAVHSRRTERLRQPIAVTRERIRYVSGEHDKKLALQPTEMREFVRARWLRIWRGCAASSAPGEAGNDRREQQHPEPPACETVRRELATTRHERRQQPRRARLGAWCHGEGLWRRPGQFKPARRGVEIGIPHLRQREIAGGVRDREEPEDLVPGNPAALGRDPHLGLSGVRAESRRPPHLGLRPQRDVPHAVDGDGCLDRLARTGARGIEVHCELQSLSNHARTRIVGGLRQRQHGNRDRIAAQRVALFSTEE